MLLEVEVVLTDTSAIVIAFIISVVAILGFISAVAWLFGTHRRNLVLLGIISDFLLLTAILVISDLGLVQAPYWFWMIFINVVIGLCVGTCGLVLGWSICLALGNAFRNKSVGVRCMGYLALILIGIVLVSSVVFFMLPDLATWLNKLIGVNFTIALWEIAFLCCVGTVGLLLFIVAVLTKPDELTSPRWDLTLGHGNTERHQALLKILGTGVAFVTGCVGLFATLYQFQGNHNDDMVDMFSSRFHDSVAFLDSDDAAVRAAGLQELATLADDYERHPELDSYLTNRDAAIDTIVTYLKKPFNPDSDTDDATSIEDEKAVRAAASNILHDHLDTSKKGACSNEERVQPSSGVTHKGRANVSDSGASQTKQEEGKDDFFLGSRVSGMESEETSSGPLCWSDHVFDFEYAKFWHADFSHAIFHQETDFTWAHFYEMSNFTQAVFEQNVHFWQTQFWPSGSSGNHTIGWAMFDSADFAGGVDFSKAIFGSAQAGQTTINDTWDVSFVGTYFDGDLSFQDAWFHGSVTFDQAKFSHNCYVNDGQPFIGQEDYNRLCSPDHPEWDDADFTDTHFAWDCDERCRLGVDTEFTNTEFYSNAIFSRGQTWTLPEFWGATFHGDTWLDILPRHTGETYTWCYPASDDDAAPDGSCLGVTDNEPPKYTTVALGPKATVHLNYQPGGDTACKITNNGTKALQEVGLACS